MTPSTGSTCQKRDFNNGFGSFLIIILRRNCFANMSYEMSGRMISLNVKDFSSANATACHLPRATMVNRSAPNTARRRRHFHPNIPATAAALRQELRLGYVTSAYHPLIGEAHVADLGSCPCKKKVFFSCRQHRRYHAGPWNGLSIGHEPWKVP